MSSDNPSAFHQLLKRWRVTPVQAAVIGASLGFLLLCLAVYLPFSDYGYDKDAGTRKLAGNLDNWRKNAGFLFLVAGLGFAGLALMFASLQVVRGEERKSQRIRQIVYGMNAVVGTVLVLIVLALINVLAYAPPIDQLTGRAFSRDFDWTRNTLYTLNTQTIKYLEGLTEPAKAYSFLDAGDPGYTEMTNLLRNVQARQPRFTWERLTLAPRPETKAIELARKYNLKDPQGGVLLIVGDEGGKHDHEFIGPDKIARQDFNPRTGQRSSKVAFSGENALLGTLKSLLEGSVTIYFTQGHGEPALDGPGRMMGAAAEAGLSELKTRLSANRRRFEVKPLTLDKATAKVPDDASALVIVRPTRAYTEEETKVLGDYLARKGETNADKTAKTAPGRLMVLLEPSLVKESGGARFQSTGLEGFLAGYGVKLADERVQVLAGSDPLRVPVLVNPRATNPLNQAFNEDGIQLFLLDKVRTVRVGDQKGGPYKAEDLLVAHPDAAVWVETDLSRDPAAVASLLKGSAAERAKRLTRDLVPVGVAVSATSGPPKMPGMPDDPAHGGGKERPLMVVIGSASWVADQGLAGQTGANRFDLFSSALSWLREQSDVGKIIDDKVNQEYELRVPETNAWRLKVMPVMLMLMAVIGLGVGVWVVRRR